MRSRNSVGDRRIDKARIKSPLLWLTMAGILFMGLSGFGIFFSRGLFDVRPTLGPIHLWGSLVATVVYCLYQYQHFQRVGLLKKALPYRLGLATFVAMVAAVISGAAVVVGPSFNVVGLSHILAGFAVLVLVVAHVLLALWIRR